MRWGGSNDKGMKLDIIADETPSPLDSPHFNPFTDNNIGNDLDDFPEFDEGLHDKNDISDPPVSYLDGLWVLKFVHTNGIHQLLTSFCQCPEAPPIDIQLLQMGLFPSTSAQPQTAFTFTVLDDYLLENLECKTSATHYYSKLWRSTSKAFSNQVKVMFHLWWHSYSSYFESSCRIDIESFSGPAGNGEV
jgi:hypothetical protein